MSLWLGIVGSSLSSSNPGMVLLKPSSIDYSGTSASIGTNGQVTFTSITSVSLNGVFTADFDNYALVLRGNASPIAITARFRSAGSDNSTASSYVRQILEADGTNLSASRTSDNSLRLAGNIGGVQRFGFTSYIYGPYLTQPTAVRTVLAGDYLSAVFTDIAGIHNQSTSYDGLTILSSGSTTGALQIYGVRS